MATLSRVLDVRALRAGSERHTLDREFAMIPLCAATETDLGSTPAERAYARSKCRYANVLPNPGSRVVLSNPKSPFINANLVPGVGTKTYIATQGPTPNTIDDFWQMVWDTKAGVIVMATGLVEGGRRKCERYWPTEEDGECTYGPFRVVTAQGVDCGEYVMTELQVRLGNATHAVTHFWYTGWPDHDAPTVGSSVLEMLHRTRARAPPGAPMVVHCSAGIGRTGTFMAIDMGMDQLDQPWRVTDIWDNVAKMRTYRGGSIQTAAQYRFVYQALQEYIAYGTPQSIFGTNVPRDVRITKRASDAWGFTLRGSSPPFLVEVDADGLAERVGAVIGDHVLAINGTDTGSLSHRECVALVRDAGSTLALTLLSKRAVPRSS